MHPAFQLLLCLIFFMLIHVSAMAACARAGGITVRSIGYGVGPTVLTWGKVHARLLPLAGNVLLKDTREESLYDDDPCLDSYHFQPLWKQVLLAIARGGKRYVAWEETVAKWLLLPGLAILLAWAAAFGWYGWQALGA